MAAAKYMEHVALHPLCFEVSSNKNSKVCSERKTGLQCDTWLDFRKCLDLSQRCNGSLPPGLSDSF